jgi:hypothetical protein
MCDRTFSSISKRLVRDFGISKSLLRSVFVARRYVVGMTILFMGVCRSLRMIRCIFNPFNGGSFKSLIGVREAFDRVLV